MKKLTKKLFSVLLALTLVLAMGVTAFAAEGDDTTTYSLTITGTTTGHTYDVYQIFSGVLSGEEGSYVLSDIVWGEGVNGTAFRTALKSDTTLGSLFTDCETAADVAEAMSGEGWTAANSQAFAELLASTTSTTTGEGDDATTTTSYTYLTTATKSGVSSAATSTEISGLTAGYYIVVETTSSVPETETVTDYIVQVVGDTTVAVKAGTVTSDKQVQGEVADAEEGADENGWGETADHAIGESFQFKLIANISADVNVTGYDTYMLIFNDTISEGITYESMGAVTISDGTDSYTLTSGQYTVSGISNGTDGEVSWTLTISDLLTLDDITDTLDLTTALTVTVTYNAHLNSEAKVGDDDSNNNTFYLTYSNNPNASASGASETGDTPEDTVYVFTYEVDGYKYTGEGSDAKALSGAEFIFYYTVTENGTTTTYYYTGTNSETGAAEWSTTESEAKTLTSGEDGKFDIVSGLDTGTYYLKETKAPDGYNSLTEAITIVISAEHSETTTGASTTITYTVDGTEQTSGTVSVLNNAGSTLPSTGGMGTTVLYTIGIILVLGAGVLLIVRRRMGASK